MPGHKKDDEKPFAFWLVERFLPHDEGTENQEGTSDRQFYFGLAIGLAIVVGVGMLIRGCVV